MIEVNDLHKSFGKVKVLNGIHLEYHPGKIYGLVGENGAGKTTLFNCIMGIYDYTGSITKSKTLKTGYLSASNFFYSQITGLEHLEFCMKAKGLPVNTPTIQHLNEIFQLPLDRYAAEYSTGMKKKLGFMALLLQDNDVFILDEPFNGISPQNPPVRIPRREYQAASRSFAYAFQPFSRCRIFCVPFPRNRIWFCYIHGGSPDSIPSASHVSWRPIYTGILPGLHVHIARSFPVSACTCGENFVF